MTTLNSARARERGTCLWTVGSTLLMSLVALGLGGCESASNILGGGNSPSPQAALSQPTGRYCRGANREDPDRTGHRLAGKCRARSANAACFIDRATTASPSRRHRMRRANTSCAAMSWRRARRPRRKSPTSGTSRISRGKRVHRITGEEVAPGAGKDPWAAVTPQVVQSIADKTATQIASWLPGSCWRPRRHQHLGRVGQARRDGGRQSPAMARMTTAAAHQRRLHRRPRTRRLHQPMAPTTGSIATSGPITAVVPMVTGRAG